MTQPQNISLRIWTELLLLGLIWGGVFLAVRITLDEIPFVTSVAHRVFWAMIVLWIYVFARKLPLPKGWRVWAALLIMGMLNNVIPFSLMAWGQLYIPSGLASVFNAATAIFGVVVAALLLRDEPLTRRKAIGVALGFAGVVIAIGLDAIRSFDIRSLAQLAVIAGTLSYAFAGVWARVHLKGLAPQTAAAGMLTGSALFMVPAAFFIDGTPSAALLPATWAALIYMVLIATAGAYLLYYRILASAGSANTMLVTLIIPPVSILLGAWVLNESLPPNVFLGLVILLLGLLILDGRWFGLHRSGRAADP